MTRAAHQSDSRLGVALVAGAAITWSTAGYFTHLIHVSLFPMLVWRNVFGGLFMLGFLWWTERGSTVHAVRSLGRIGWFVAVVNGMSMVCYLSALRHTSVANVVVIYATAPFVAAGLAFLLYRDRATRRTLATGVVALVGVAITVGGTPGSSGLLGDLLAGGMTLGVAIFTIVARRHRDRSMVAAAALSAWVGILIALPFTSPSSLHVSPLQLAQLALFGVTSFGLGLILYTIGARHLHAARSALISALDTPLAPLWVWLAFGLRPAVASVIGGGIVLTAVIANILSERSPAPVRAGEPVVESG
jgi:drug/metabolite transporter (DMT)-like permease